MERHWIHPPEQSSTGMRKLILQRPGKSMRQLRVQVYKWTHRDRHKTRKQNEEMQIGPIHKEKKEDKIDER